MEVVLVVEGSKQICSPPRVISGAAPKKSVLSSGFETDLVSRNQGGHNSFTKDHPNDVGNVQELECPHNHDY